MNQKTKQKTLQRQRKKQAVKQLHFVSEKVVCF